MGWPIFTTGVDTTDILAGLKVDAEDIEFTTEEVATATTLTADHFMVAVNASSGSVTITLPAAASHTDRIYTIKKIDSSGNKVTIDGNSDEKIDGEETVDLNLQYSYVTIVCDGDEWFIIGGRNVKIEELVKDGNEIQRDILNLLRLFKKALKKMSNLDLKEG